MQRTATELFLARSAAFNRSLWLGDSTRSWRVDIQSPELKAALAEMQELIEKIEQTPDGNEKSEEWSVRIQELNLRIRAAIGLGIESER